MTSVCTVRIPLSRRGARLFVSIAFDSGGAAAGSLSSSFVLPFIVGICTAVGSDSMLYAFGTIAIISILPTIVIQIMGIRYNYVLNKSKRKSRKKAINVVVYDFE